MKLESFRPTPRILMGPGPSDVHPRVLEALSRPTVGHPARSLTSRGARHTRTRGGCEQLRSTDDGPRHKCNAPARRGPERARPPRPKAAPRFKTPHTSRDYHKYSIYYSTPLLSRTPRSRPGVAPSAVEPPEEKMTFLETNWPFSRRK